MSNDKNEKDHSTGHILQSLIVNALIASFKGFAAFMTSSGSMFAETIHSFSDCANQLLLLVGVRQARRPASEKHPLGYGRAAYFWSFMVAMLLFSVGGLFSVYEGIHKFSHPEQVENVGWGIAVLLFALALEGYSTYSNIVEIRKRKKELSFFRYISSTKDSDLIVVFGENSAAVIGLVFALAALLLSWFTGDGRYDALGSIAIGVVLVGVAIFLSVEIKSLLIGESADPMIIELIKKTVSSREDVEELINYKTIQQGPGEILVCLKIKCRPTLTFDQISRLINGIEHDLRTAAPDLKWIYIEPDYQEWKGPENQ